MEGGGGPVLPGHGSAPGSSWPVPAGSGRAAEGNSSVTTPLRGCSSLPPCPPAPLAQPRSNRATLVARPKSFRVGYWRRFLDGAGTRGPARSGVGGGDTACPLSRSHPVNQRGSRAPHHRGQRGGGSPGGGRPTSAVRRPREPRGLCRVGCPALAARREPGSRFPAVDGDSRGAGIG